MSPDQAPHVGLLRGDEHGDERDELVRVEPAKNAVEQQLGGEQLVAGADAARRAPLERHHALRAHMPQPPQHSGPAWRRWVLPI